MKIENGGQAFPRAASGVPGYIDREGMTLRDYFAAKAMQGIITGVAVMGAGMQSDEPFSAGPVAHDAYKMADAMLKARSEPQHGDSK